jgi:hypothetical protein
MSLNLSFETTSIFEKSRSEVSAPDLLVGLGRTVVNGDSTIIPSPRNLDNRVNNMIGPFIKLSRDALELVESDPDAFLLLTQISLRARRKKSKYDLDNLEPNQAYIGDYKTIGLTDKRYRLAKERVEQKYFLATFKGTNKGTIATLTSSDVYDINIDSEGDQTDEQKTIPKANQGRAEGEPRATNKECKNVRIKNNTPIPPASPGAVQLYEFFIISMKKFLPTFPESKLPKKETARNFDRILKDHCAERIKQVITFAHSGWWSAHVHGPKYLKDKFEKISMSLDRDLKTKTGSKPEKSSPVTVDGPRRANELVV